ncbi:MAG: ArnT family glycosyltransferase [Terriglobales bacterium]
MRDLLRRSKLYFALLTAAAIALRLVFVLRFPVLTDDGFVYGDLAKNLLQHGFFGISGPDGPTPTLIRMPGYPAYIAAIWSVTGVEHYRALLWTQLAVDVATCFVIADFARRIVGSGRAAKLAFVLATLCPFTANYVASALTETLAIFFAALALDTAAMALSSARLRDWALCGAAVAGGILLRPDGGILLPVIAGYALLCSRQDARRRLAVATVLTAVALGPLVPWTIRNWRMFHVVQPLAPQYANEPDEFVPLGFGRWIKTWIADYSSVTEVLWAEPQDAIMDRLPDRAFDDAAERERVAALLAAYKADGMTVGPALDHEFAELASRRIQRHPLRYYVWLPALRIAGMWLRPRTELLGLEDRWWDYENDPHDATIAMALGVVNLAYVLAAIAAAAYWVWVRPGWRYGGMLLAFVVARSAFLGTVGNPEPRYSLECYPVVMVYAAALVARKTRGRAPERAHALASVPASVSQN